MVTPVEQALDRLDLWLVRRDATGWDPYDGLASPLAKLVRGRRPRQAVAQLIKRAPGSLRRAAAVPQHRMSKTLALLAASLGVATWLPRAEQRRLDLIAELVSRRGADAWGYEFDVQTRWGHYPAGSPNAVVTAFACEVVAAALSVDDRARVVEWLTGPMWAGNHFRYVPGNPTLVHNANVLAARTLQRLSPGHPLVDEAVSTTVRALPDNGLWPYGESAGLAWVDNFHTAYVLDALLDLTPAREYVATSIDRAAACYVQRCFTADGRPYYYAERPGPLDVHNVATALNMLKRLHDLGLARAAVLEGCAEFALSLQRQDGAFVAKPGAVPFVRWNQAHMHLALAKVCA